MPPDGESPRLPPRPRVQPGHPHGYGTKPPPLPKRPNATPAVPKRPPPRPQSVAFDRSIDYGVDARGLSVPASLVANDGVVSPVGKSLELPIAYNARIVAARWRGCGGMWRDPTRVDAFVDAEAYDLNDPNAPTERYLLRDGLEIVVRDHDADCAAVRFSTHSGEPRVAWVEKRFVRWKDAFRAVLTRPIHDLEATMTVCAGSAPAYVQGYVDVPDVSTHPVELLVKRFNLDTKRSFEVDIRGHGGVAYAAVVLGTHFKPTEDDVDPPPEGVVKFRLRPRSVARKALADLGDAFHDARAAVAKRVHHASKSAHNAVLVANARRSRRLTSSSHNMP